MSPRLFVGTYAHTGGAGLHALSRSESGSGWALGEAYAGAQNASFGTCSSRHIYYFVDEQAEGALGAYRLTDDGWQCLARVRTHGAGPCYVALNRDETSVAVANYASGNIAVYRLDQRTGVPIEPPVLRQNHGNGPMKERQDGPHAHCVCFSRDQRWIYQVDLGTDEVIAFPIDPETKEVGERTIAYQAPAGSGPRHLVFHPVLPLGLLISELASTLTLVQIDNGRLIARQELSTLPSDFKGDNVAGHVSVDEAGERVYVTNRGHDSIGVFEWNELGALQLIQHMPSGGVSPRSFVILEDERRLLVAHEKSSNVTVFNILADGKLAPQSANVAVPGAVFLLVGR